MILIGIDPGSVSGAYALVDHQLRILDVDDLPVANRQVDAAEFARIVQQFKPDGAVVEDVWAFPKQGVMSSFRFGVGVGIIRGVLLGAGIPVSYVTPAKWKKAMGLNSEAEKSRDLAIRTWPTCRKLSRKRDHGRAEALLLAKYGHEDRGPF
jgi:Holliday junction resolvasome RuvABC endonuclease subunit